MKKIQWPTAIVLIVTIVALAVVYLAGPSVGVPDESHSTVVTGIAALGALVLASMQKLIGGDKDRDGIPAILDADGDK